MNKEKVYSGYFRDGMRNGTAENKMQLCDFTSCNKVLQNSTYIV